MRIQLVPNAAHTSFLDLPWREPLEEWTSDRLVEVVRGISRHVVRFVDYDGVLYAVKELPERPASREYGLLRRLTHEGLPAVDAVGLVTDRGGDLDAILITRHLEFSLPYRVVFARRVVADLTNRLLDSLAELLVRLHLTGFFWGDCSLSNTLFRRDAGALSAYLVDAETGELHEHLSDGQRRHDLDIAEENLAGELCDLAAELELDSDLEAFTVAAEARRRYERLWSELMDEETVGPTEGFRLEQRVRRLNELGFDVEELDLVESDGAFKLRLHPKVVEAGHHRRRLLRLTGLEAQENQARRLLNDVTAFRSSLEQRGERPVSDAAAAGRWLTEIFEPAVAAVPLDLRGKRAAAELYHELLEHRWRLSESSGTDVPLDEAVISYVEDVLRPAPEERAAVRT